MWGLYIQYEACSEKKEKKPMNGKRKTCYTLLVVSPMDHILTSGDDWIVTEREGGNVKREKLQVKGNTKKKKSCVKELLDKV